MARNPENDFCFKFDSGLCAIHKKYGSDFLGDACHFYPRVTRKFADEIFMAASLSCPEISRLALTSGKDKFNYESDDVERLPLIKDYLADGELTSGDAASVMKIFLSLADDGSTPEKIISRIVSLGSTFDILARKDWAAAAAFMARTVDERLLPAETLLSDPYNLLNILSGLLISSKKNLPALDEILNSMKAALGVRINPITFAVEQVEKKDFSVLQKNFEQDFSAAVAPFLRNWIRAQLTISAFPFSGFGNSPKERAIIIAVRFATLKLALMANMQHLSESPENTIVALAQTLSRFMDHLADPAVSLSCYEEAGWHDPMRLRGLVGDYT